ncbi:cytochrome c biogenesis protein CcsA [candidate division KSB1 bacterium]|nr:cytochrome c biogenesis protein CcsA [candidate division KSB1 bacterium]
MIRHKTLKIVLTILMSFVLFGSFLYTRNAAGFPGESSRIMFFHVPQAWVAVMAFSLSMVFSVIYLKKRDVRYDMLAVSSSELGFLFCILAMLTGSMFARLTWGSFWNWDPRETSILILLMIYGAYFALRSAVNDQDDKRKFSAVYSLLAFATVPFFIFIVPRITISLHPSDTMNPMNPQLDFRFMLVFILALVAFTGIFFWMLSLKYRWLQLEEKFNRMDTSWDLD